MFLKFYRSGCHRVVKKANVRKCSNQSITPNTIDSSASGKIPITKIPLSEAVPGLPTAVYATPCLISKETKVTTLENGLKVASETKFGNFCTVGVLLDSGSRYECAYPSGLSHFLEKLAFGDTVNKTRKEITETFDRLGGICDCQSSRDTLIYATSVETTGLEKAIELLGEVSLRPLITEEEVNDARISVTYDLEALHLRPEKDLLLMEMVHAAGYRDNTLGLSKTCPPENISVVDRNTLFTYLKQTHVPERMVLAAVGVDHDKLVEYAQKHFVDNKPIWESDSSLVKLQPNLPVDKSHAQYTGGIVQQEADLSNVSMGPNPLPELAHFVLGLESVGHQDADFVACCVLSMMMGGGGSFSAGGPGKGMYTRLYTNILNRYHWMHTATCLNHSYVDSGLFCIHASCHPSYLGDMTRMITREMVAMAGSIKEEEFNRAKVQLQSMLLMNLESRPVIFEDVGRQVLATGMRHQPNYFMDKIKSVTMQDITRLSSQMLSTKPSVAAMGSLTKMPSVSDISAGLVHSDGQVPLKNRFKIFR